MSQRKPARRTPPPTPAKPFLTPGASPLRRSIERRSAVFVLLLRGLPRLVPALLVLGIVAGGIALPGVGGALCLLLGALILGWLAYLAWPALPTPGRLIRLAVVVALVSIAADRLAD